MYRMRRPRRIGSTASEFLTGAFVAIIVSAVIAGIAYGVYALVVQENNSVARSNAELLKLLESDGDNAKDSSEAAIQRRKEKAQGYIALEAVAEKISGDAEHLGLEDDDWKQIKKVAETGKPIQLDTETRSYGAPFNSPILLYWILGTWIAVGLGALVKFSEARDYHDWDYRLADLNWKRSSTWIVTCVFGPLVWIAMAISRILLIWTPYPPENQESRDTGLEDVDEDEDDADEATPPNTPNQTYVSAPAAARAAYVSLRTDAAKSYQATRLREVESNIEHQQTTARKIGAQLKEIQGELNQLRATRTQLAESLDSEVVSADIANQEFERITRLPGIIATQVVNDYLRLIIRATHEYKGKVYDLGDWRIDLRPDSDGVKAHSIRYRLRSGWRLGTYPSYAYNDGSFCFGSRHETINEHVQKGQYLEAVSVAIDTLCGINKGERKLVPSAFYAIES